MNTHTAIARRLGATLIALSMTAAVLLVTGGTANAAIVPTVPMGTAANYAVLGASTVTNTGGTVLDSSLGLSPGTSITGFPPGLVLPPGTTDTTNAAAALAQSALTAAYGNAAGRSIDATTTSDLANLILKPGVYAGPNKSPLGLTGPLVLDGEGNLAAVFIFQTDSTLITGSASTVTLINGAQECNVFWQVGSSATLGSGSVFAGTILALTSISLKRSVVVHGRALARNGAVTLINDTFTKPTCAQVAPTTTTAGGGTTTTTSAGGTTTTTGAGGTTTTTVAGGTTTTTKPGDSTTSTVVGTILPPITSAGVTTTTAPLGTPPTTPSGRGAPPTTPGTGGPDVPPVLGPPRTGGAPLRAGGSWLAVLFTSLVGGALVLGAADRRRTNLHDALEA